MDRDQVTRRDFPAEGGGYDRASVDAHLVAVDALIAAAEAEVAALKVERDALRRPDSPDGRDEPAGAASATDSLPRTESGAGAGSGSGTESESDPADAATSPGTAPEPDDGSGSASGATGRSETGGDEEVSARLVATKMAMDGADRNSIRDRLEHDYELSDTDGLIDDLFERLG